MEKPVNGWHTTLLSWWHTHCFPMDRGLWVSAHPVQPASRVESMQFTFSILQRSFWDFLQVLRGEHMVGAQIDWGWRSEWVKRRTEPVYNRSKTLRSGHSITIFLRRSRTEFVMYNVRIVRSGGLGAVTGWIPSPHLDLSSRSFLNSALLPSQLAAEIWIFCPISSRIPWWLVPECRWDFFDLTKTESF